MDTEVKVNNATRRDCKLSGKPMSLFTDIVHDEVQFGATILGAKRVPICLMACNLTVVNNKI
jgi:hypothetical protein